MLILAPLLVPLLTALLAGLAPAGMKRPISLAGGLLLLVCSVALLWTVEQDGPLTVAIGAWPLPMGIEFAADRLSAAMVLITALLGVAVLLQQGSAAEPAEESAGLYPLLHGLLAAAGASYVSADLFNLYVWFELGLICALGLLVLGGEKRHLEAACKYFALNMLGTLLMLSAVALLHGLTGQLNFNALRAAAQDPAMAARLTPALALLTLAFLLKAAAFPLFAWLPASYHTLPAPLLALFGGVTTKVAVYALLRLLADVFAGAPLVLYQALGWIAVLTMVSGVLGAAYHWDLRRILAFHIVSQIGYLLLGIALMSPAGYAAVLFLTWHNILIKSALFLIAGIIWKLAGHHDLRRVGGLYPAHPVLAMLFLIAAFSLVGVPPSSGFWGKLLLVKTAFAQEQYLWGGIALAVGLLTLYSMSKIWLEAFWKPHPEPQPGLLAGRSVRLAPAYAAVGLLVGIALAIGLLPEPMISYAGAAAAGLGGIRP